MHVLKKVGIATGLVAAAAASIALAVPANADTGAQSGDIVAVGSDTLQNAVNFALDGSPGVAGGYNTGSNKNRVISYDATSDANGRAIYDSTAATLPTSVILRAGTKPVPRPNGSGAGAAALTADTTLGGGYAGLPVGSIQFARMSRLPNSTEEGNCPTSNPSCGGLHVYQIATDTLSIAHVTGSAYKGVAGLSVQQLVKIYSCDPTARMWTQVGGTSTDSIIPLIPQSGSGTRNFFLDELAAANGGTAVALGSCVQVVQEHDPSGISSQSTPGDAIEPFSGAKIKLLNTGYFAMGSSAAQYQPNYLTNLTGTPSDGNTVFTTTRGVYITVRQADVTSTVVFQPGGTQNWVSSVITGGASAFRSPSGKAQIVAAGFTAVYKDCVTLNPTSC